MNVIREILDKEEKKRISRKILEVLPNWFGIKEAREEYISDCESQYFLRQKKIERQLDFYA
jgi:hypothetical protein